MLCDRCHKRDATIQVSQIVNGQTVEHHLCEVCAKELGLETNIESMFDNFFNHSVFGSSVFNPTGGIPIFGKPVQRNLVCPNCGLTFDEFRSSGLFGCAKCYEAFADRLDPVFRRVQGGTRHVGHKLRENPQIQEKKSRPAGSPSCARSSLRLSRTRIMKKLPG